MSETLEELALKKLHELAYRKELNVFKVLNNADHEIRHSSFLAWLFDPEENHGFESEFAVEFFYNAFKVKMLTEKFKNLEDEESKAEDEIIKDWDKFKAIEFNVEDYTIADWKERFSVKKFSCLHCKNGKPNTYIDTEVRARSYEKNDSTEEDKKGRIDIFVKGADFTCTIENKTYSVEHDGQLKTYKDFINDEYKNYTNFFIYLGITKPEDFYAKNYAEKHSTAKKQISENPYDGYIFVSYKIVINILNDLLKKDRTVGKIDGEVKKFIKQYLVVLNEYYGNFDGDAKELEKTKEICNEILKDNKLAETINNFDDRKLTPKLIDGKRIFQNYHVRIQKPNDVLIYNTLLDIMNDDYTDLIDYHKGSSRKKNPYANTIRINEGEGAAKKDNKEAFKNHFMDNDDKELKKIWKTHLYLNQIDYNAKYAAYNIVFIYGAGVITSRNCFEYIYKHMNDFCDSLNSRLENGWNVIFEYVVRPAKGPHIPEGFNKSAFSKNIATIDQVKELLEKLRKHKPFETKSCVAQHSKTALIKNGKAIDEHPVFVMVKDMFSDEDNDFYDNFKKSVEAYFKKNNKDTSNLRFSWNLTLIYTLPETPIITDTDRDKIEASLGKDFYEKTQEGLEPFKLDKAFMKIFKPQE